MTTPVLMIATPPRPCRKAGERQPENHLNDARHNVAVGMEGRERAFAGAVAEREDDDERDVPADEEGHGVALWSCTREQRDEGDQRTWRHGRKQAEPHDGEKKSRHSCHNLKPLSLTQRPVFGLD
jgi:hypothetical protein